jgi:hypothetical protein
MSLGIGKTLYQTGRVFNTRAYTRVMSLVINKVRLQKKKTAKIALTFKGGETQKNPQI